MTEPKNNAIPTPTTHGDWHIVDGQLVDLSKKTSGPPSPRPKLAAVKAAAEDQTNATSKEQ